MDTIDVKTEQIKVKSHLLISLERPYLQALQPKHESYKKSKGNVCNQQVGSSSLSTGSIAKSPVAVGSQGFAFLKINGKFCSLDSILDSIFLKRKKLPSHRSLNLPKTY